MSSACTSSLNDAISSSSKFNAWYERNKLILTAFQSISTPTSAQQNTLLDVGSELTNMSVCLQEKISSSTSTPNDISNAYDDIYRLSEEIKLAEVNSNTAKNRVAYIRHPEQDVSYYESWFPLDRPLQTLTVIVLISICIFMSTFLLLMAMSLTGYDLYLFVSPNRTSSSYQQSYISWIYSQLTFPFWIALAVIVAVVLYYKYK